MALLWIKYNLCWKREGDEHWKEVTITFSRQGRVKRKKT